MRTVDRTAIANLIKHLEGNPNDSITLKRKSLLEVLRCLAANTPGDMLRVPQGSYLLSDSDGVTLVMEVTQRDLTERGLHRLRRDLETHMNGVLSVHLKQVAAYSEKAMKEKVAVRVKEFASPVRCVHQFITERTQEDL